LEAKTIILIEDDPDHADLIIDAFRDQGVEHYIVLVRDGQAAIDYFQKMELEWRGVVDDKITLILLDLNLPKICGMDVIKFLKNESAYSRIPVVVMSTSSDKNTIDEAYDNGVDRFVTKPVSYEEFVEKLETLKEYC
jgi:two-component system response regulator